MSLLKFHDEEISADGRGEVLFNRAHLDGAPWRGPTYPLKEEEYYDYTDEILDFDVGLFDIREPADRLKMKEIMDKAANNWYRIIDYDKEWIEKADGEKTILVYIAWVVPFRELAKNRVKAELAATTIPMIKQ